ncbi:MAG: urea transporter [Alphaproteobacteria bacterium]
MAPDLRKAARTLLTGIGQVMLQENPVTGLFFFAGLLVASPLMCAGAVFGVVTAMLTAHSLKLPENNTSAGLYGFNAALVGIALPYFFMPSLPLIGLIVAGSVLSVLIMHWQLKKLPLPAYTSAFVVTTWGAYALAKALHLDPATHASFTSAIPDGGVLDGVGQVMFQDNVFTGLLFALGILYNSRSHGCCALGGSVVGVLVATALQCPPDLIADGIFSYNAVLCAVALSGKTSLKDLAYPGACAAASVMVLLLFQKAGIIALTAPFVLSSWLFVYIRRKTGWPAS